MSTLTERFGEKVRKLREKRKLSQLNLAEKARVDLTTINEIENGNRQPMLKTIWKISNALNVKMADLFDFHTMRNNDFGNLLVNDKEPSARKKR